MFSGAPLVYNEGMPSIKLSFFDLFKIGPGPSSSHTIGPMRAGADFLARIASLPSALQQRADAVRVTLSGSLSATGKGHGTDRAVLAGLLGWQPESCDPQAFAVLLSDANTSYELCAGSVRVAVSSASVVFGPVQHEFPFSNTMVFALLDGEASLFEQEYYSVGGGFIQWKGWREPELPEPVFPFASMETLKSILRASSTDLASVARANEKAIFGTRDDELDAGVDCIVTTMLESVERGLCTDAMLPGSIHLHRKAAIVFARALGETCEGDRMLACLNAYALAASEENAAGNRTVTAPTSGSAGVIPGLLYLLHHHQQASLEALREGMLVAALIGFLFKHNASISGAEAGCMGEVGTAAAMGAALVAKVKGAPLEVIEAAAEIAMEHHLGMTCDPVGGYVQIPCIERNAVGAVKAYNAYILASSGNAVYQKVSLDKVIAAVRDTARDMSMKYKETSLGGLAVSIAEC